MDISSIHNVSVLGIQRSLTEIRRSSQEIAQIGTSDRDANTIDLAKNLVNIKHHQGLIEANVRVINTESEVLGTVIDIFV